jgi:type II secretory pathway pseudopilin PulG
MTQRLTRSESGFTYIAALFMVVIMGILMGAVGQSVKVIMQREREKELIFRGLQYRDAIERWSKKKKGVLKDLKDLVEPTVSGNVNRSEDRLLRKLYKDPMTGADWKTLPPTPDPVQGIIGVVSTSSEKPFKQSNFPEVIKNFEGKTKYSEWEFTYKLQPQVAQGSQSSSQQKQLSFPTSTPESP